MPTAPSATPTPTTPGTRNLSKVFGFMRSPLFPAPVSTGRGFRKPSVRIARNGRCPGTEDLRRAARGRALRPNLYDHAPELGLDPARGAAAGALRDDVLAPPARRRAGERHGRSHLRGPAAAGCDRPLQPRHSRTERGSDPAGDRRRRPRLAKGGGTGAAPALVLRRQGDG